MEKLPEHIVFSDNPAEKLDKIIELMQPDKVAFLVDENTKKHCLIDFANHKEYVIEIPSGEKNKNIETCSYIWDNLTKWSFSRKSMLINLGGGVIGDMGGFAASTYKRGIRFVNIPTTLLSQVDASIGGKLGIDFGMLKNHIGIFRNPDAIIISNQFLKTLSRREIKSGFAEIIKHGLIWDKEYWNALKNINIDSHADFQDITYHSVKIKNQVVLADPTEKDLRKILNFGHTVGHAIETWNIETGNSITHGEAIIAGMIIESKISELISLLPSEDSDEIIEMLNQKYGKIKTPDSEELFKLMMHDKKNQDGKISFSLLKKVGECDFDISADSDAVIDSLNFYKNLNK